jgi:hypothetical protein
MARLRRMLANTATKVYMVEFVLAPWQTTPQVGEHRNNSECRGKNRNYGYSTIASCTLAWRLRECEMIVVAWDRVTALLGRLAVRQERFTSNFIWAKFTNYLSQGTTKLSRLAVTYLNELTNNSRSSDVLNPVTKHHLC